MSSKWVQVRDSLLEAVKAEEVGKELKDNLVDWAEKDETGVNYLVDADNHPVVKQPTRLEAADAQFILIHYTSNYVSYITATWTDVVGYDLYDSFFGGVKQGEN